MIEEWKEIEKYNGAISISNFGKFRNNNTGNILNIRPKSKKKTLYVQTTINHKMVCINTKKEFIYTFFKDSEYEKYRFIDNNNYNMCKENLIKENKKIKIPNTYNIIEDYVEVYTEKMERFLIDLEDLDLINNYKWYRRTDGYISCSCFGGKGRVMFLHRAIMSKHNEIKEKNIDHINRKRSDNRKENLRIVTSQQNNFNQSIGKGNTSGFLGVAKRTQNTKKNGVSEYWRAQIKYNGKHISKQFKNKEDAIKWRLQKELEYFGKEFAPQRYLFEEYGIK